MLNYLNKLILYFSYLSSTHSLLLFAFLALLTLLLGRFESMLIPDCRDVLIELLFGYFEGIWQ